MTMCLVCVSGIRDRGLCLLSMISLYPLSTSTNKYFMMTCLFFAKVLANFDNQIVASIRAQSESRFVKNRFASIATKQQKRHQAVATPLPHPGHRCVYRTSILRFADNYKDQRHLFVGEVVKNLSKGFAVLFEGPGCRCERCRIGIRHISPTKVWRYSFNP